MEKQASLHQYAHTNADHKSSHFSQDFIHNGTETASNKPTQMRVLFSGHGKAEKNMGMAAVPPLWTPGPPPWR